MTPFFYVFRIPRRRSHKKKDTSHHLCDLVLQLLCTTKTLVPTFRAQIAPSHTSQVPKRSRTRQWCPLFECTVLNAQRTFETIRRLILLRYPTFCYIFTPQLNLPLHSFIIMKSLSRATVAAIAIFGEFRKAIMVKIRSSRASLVLPIIFD